MLADGTGAIESRFLEAIDHNDHSDDDLARGVYADWLEEQGEDARAEYLRLQLELAMIDDPAELGARARELAMLAAALDDTAWCARVEHRGLVERFANTKIASWLGFGYGSRHQRPFELPEQLRYLERLVPITPPPPIVLQPLRRR